MRMILCIALMLSALLLLPAPRPSVGCTDNDGDSDCQPADCNDNDPDQNSLDLDGDGYTSCVNDCDDYDPSVNRCKVSRRQYPYYTYDDNTCYRIYERYDKYSCPAGQDPTAQYHQCTFVGSSEVWSTQCLF